MKNSFKTLIPFLIISVILTVSAGTFPFFIVGLEFVLLPIIILFFLIGLTGLITVPIVVMMVVKNKLPNKLLIKTSGIAVGFYLGSLIQLPINNWDERQRNLSGQVLTEELESFKKRNGRYPANLSQLNTTNISKKLPVNYTIDRFTYHLKENGFDLDIPVPILDRWHWNRDQRKFEYDDY